MQKVMDNLKGFLESLPQTSAVRTAFLQLFGAGLGHRDFAQLLGLREDSVRKTFKKEAIDIKDLFVCLVRCLSFSFRKSLF